MLAALVFGEAASGPVFAAPVTQTIVLIRHGEKPPGGLGRLDCRGLNRAEALPPVLARQFGRFDAIFAPDPDRQKKDEGIKYPYLRPLETITPLSKATGLPVETRFGYKQIGKLEEALESPGYRGATLLVAWEHKQLVKLARSLLDHHGGDARQAGKWPGSDFDSIYVVRIVRDGESTRAAFEHGHQGLTGKLGACTDG
ncbi:hypothetical protein [Bosea vestrisii]|uniref:Histidine phosphatase family protein n=1 Tax=Bosea vestrisii TaxID=151416 RepID=A0ABW0H7B0_9HYPH